ncbi:hypothetical protein ACT3XG_21085 [Paenibacillus polymyxa]|jgi:FtsZ-interacting cell division protein ZipA|uniref:hypothetical protein n=1 Tax=Paenibacillus TaxID=44249 RepID=UPI0002EA3C01|nr:MULTISPECIES: hypothetical protein [Paenibacillus]AHM67939.1 hypothetical protein PPSQR21_043340 [Paenibacillus polymyxa SQR-21]AIY08649.1 hypothetical protein LK13_08660 [Paenibacillus polymyxa]KAF6583945.1 hypothetical protein G9G57_11125 [Paenibacillus sp. EKM211P]KAF6654605.1 hypothetical protein HFD99_18495 [Paenibacillus sp. EKM301P]KJD40096.1 hypothetical protein QD46_10270 [Paenibacillus polymyxa]
MTIAFIVVAVVAFIFLLVFNTKMTRKSSAKNRPNQEESRQRSKRPYPVQVEPKAHELTEHTGEIQPKNSSVEEHRAEEQHKLPDIQTDIKVEKDRENTEGAYGDQDYRAALRGFAGKDEEKDGHSRLSNGEKENSKSEDEQYREALRSMNRKK